MMHKTTTNDLETFEKNLVGTKSPKKPDTLSPNTIETSFSKDIKPLSNIKINDPVENHAVITLLTKKDDCSVSATIKPVEVFNKKRRTKSDRTSLTATPVRLKRALDQNGRPISKPSKIFVTFCGRKSSKTTIEETLELLSII